MIILASLMIGLVLLLKFSSQLILIDPTIKPLFLPLEDSHYYVPTGFYSESHYKFAGSIVALALKFGITTRVEFILIYRLILGIETS